MFLIFLSEIEYLPYTIQIIHVTPNFLRHFDKLFPWELTELKKVVLTCPGFSNRKPLVGEEKKEVSLSGVKVEKVKGEYKELILLEVRPAFHLYSPSKYGLYLIKGSYLKDKTNEAFEKTFDLLVSTLRIEELIKSVPEALRIEERLKEIKKRMEDTTK